MEQDFLKEIERITKKETFELHPEEIAFLKARIGYLTQEQLEKFQSVLAENKETKIKSKKTK